MAGNINQVMHISNITSVHLERDIVQWNTAHFKVNYHRSWKVYIHFVIFTLSNISSISKGMCASGKLRCPTPRNINQGLYAIDLDCAHKSCDIGLSKK